MRASAITTQRVAFNPPSSSSTTFHIDSFIHGSSIPLIADYFWASPDRFRSNGITIKERPGIKGPRRRAIYWLPSGTKLLAYCLNRREVEPRKLDERGEAHLIALACSPAPEGHDHWTLRLLAGKVVELGLAPSMSHEGIRKRLKKTLSSRGRRRSGASLR